MTLEKVSTIWSSTEAIKRKLYQPRVWISASTLMPSKGQTYTHTHTHTHTHTNTHNTDARTHRRAYTHVDVHTHTPKNPQTRFTHIHCKLMGTNCVPVHMCKHRYTHTHTHTTHTTTHTLHTHIHTHTWMQPIRCTTVREKHQWAS